MVRVQQSCVAETVVEFERHPGNVFGMREVRIEGVRPQLHPTRGELLNLFALW